MNDRGYVLSHARVEHSEKEYARYELGPRSDPYEHDGRLFQPVQVALRGVYQRL